MKILTILFSDPLVPKYYYVPYQNIIAERESPGSQERCVSKEGASESNVFLWGQVRHNNFLCIGGTDSNTLLILVSFLIFIVNEKII